MFGWLKKKNSVPDFSSLNSREKVDFATRNGDLVPMFLMPKEFGGLDVGLNIVFVPAWAAQQKQRIDTDTIFPLAQEGKIKKYLANPSYKGDSFVPSVITIRAHDPSDFTVTIEIW